MNPSNLMTVMSSWQTFIGNHPKFPAFLNAVKTEGVKEGTIIEVSITSPEGKRIETNIKVTDSDLELFNTIKSMS